VTFRIQGLDCAEEVAVLRREVGPLVGGAERLAFDVLGGKMTVLGEGVPVAAVVAAVRKAGMVATLEGGAREEAPEGRDWRTVLMVASGVSAAAGFGLEWMGADGRWGYGAAIVLGTALVLPKAWLALRRGRPDMNLLMVVAIGGAVGIGDWLEGASVAFLFALSLTLEAWSVGRARRAIGELLDLAPRMVRLVGGEELAAEAVAVGSRFQVRPGERIALDGEVESGISEVNQAPITGESMAVRKEAGAVVYAGTVNGGGALVVRSTKPSGDTALAHIVRLVGEAQQKRAPAERWVDRFAAVYTPAVLGLAVLVFLVPVVGMGLGAAEWFYQALVLLVIACPCALVIATPVGVVAALTAAARAGVLVKGGVHLETLARVKAVAFDKTGTLTTGQPEVVEVVALAGHTEEELLERAVALEAHSDHPMARAIVAYGLARRIEPLPASEFTILPGKGAVGSWQGRRFWLGSHRYLEELGQETPEIHERLEALGRSGRTVVVVGNESHVCGFLALADTVRPEAGAAVRELLGLGMERVVMLTGDNRGTAEAVGREAGIGEVAAELLPADKVRLVEELVGRYGCVAMVGDGINDAPALGRASVGIAMGVAGSDTAMEAADVALLADDLGKLPWLVRHGRRMMGVIRTNIGLALGVKALFVVLTFGGHGSLWAAIGADMGMSLLVIFNALRLLRG
jgi:Cd2+/Zn2+-exporting ATPase